MKYFGILLGLFLSLAALPALADTPTVERPAAILRALDKVTGRVAEIVVAKERPYKFGTIFITVHSCRETTPEEAPESAAFLTVNEFKAGKDKLDIFNGWMFASSPALSAMEHPVYDLWLIGCKSEGESSENKTES